MDEIGSFLEGLGGTPLCSPEPAVCEHLYLEALNAFALDSDRRLSPFRLRSRFEPNTRKAGPRHVLVQELRVLKLKTPCLTPTIMITRTVIHMIMITTATGSRLQSMGIAMRSWTAQVHTSTASCHSLRDETSTSEHSR